MLHATCLFDLLVSYLVTTQTQTQSGRVRRDVPALLSNLTSVKENGGLHRKVSFILFSYIMICCIHIIDIRIAIVFYIIHIQTCEAHQHLVLTKSIYFKRAAG